MCSSLLKIQLSKWMVTEYQLICALFEINYYKWNIISDERIPDDPLYINIFSLRKKVNDRE